MWALILKAIGLIGGIFGVLKASGVAPDLDTVAINDITSVTAYESDYASGQAVIIGTVSIAGQAGVIAIMDNGGAAYQAIFGSNANPGVGTVS